jgi:hypothetical protein
VVIGWTLDAQGDVGVWRVGRDLVVERVAIGDEFRDARPEAVVATDGGFVIVGAVIDGDRAEAAVWSSPDGAAWQRLPSGSWSEAGGLIDTGETPGSGGMRTAAAYGIGVVAAGTVCDEEGATCRAAVWRSTNGRNWERAEASSSSLVLSSVASADETLVAAGGDTTGRTGSALWWSDHGEVTVETNDAWPAFEASAATAHGATLLGWDARSGPDLWHTTGPGELARLAGVPAPPGVLVPLGGDVEQLAASTLVLTSVETRDGIAAFVLRGVPA